MNEIEMARIAFYNATGLPPDKTELMLWLIWKELRRSAEAAETANKNTEVMRLLYERRDREQREGKL